MTLSQRIQRRVRVMQQHTGGSQSHSRQWVSLDVNNQEFSELQQGCRLPREERDDRKRDWRASWRSRGGQDASSGKEVWLQFRRGRGDDEAQASPTHRACVCRRGGSPPKTLSWSAAVQTKQTDDVWNGGGHSLQYFHATQVQCHCIWTVVYTTTSTITMTIIIVFFCTQQSKCCVLFRMKCTNHFLQEDMEWRDVMWPGPRWNLRMFLCSRPWKSYYHRQTTF